MRYLRLKVPHYAPLSSVGILFGAGILYVAVLVEFGDLGATNETRPPVLSPWNVLEMLQPFEALNELTHKDQEFERRAA